MGGEQDGPQAQQSTQQEGNQQQTPQQPQPQVQVGASGAQTSCRHPCPPESVLHLKAFDIRLSNATTK